MSWKDYQIRLKLITKKLTGVSFNCHTFFFLVLVNIISQVQRQKVNALNAVLDWKVKNLDKGKILCRIGLHKWNEKDVTRKPFESMKCLREGCKGLYEFNGMFGCYCGVIGMEKDQSESRRMSTM